MTESVWMKSAMPLYPTLARETETDVCIIGAGIAGLTCAYHLSQSGQSVIVLEAGTVGGGETSRTTAHLTAAVDNGYAMVAALHGKDHARTVAESHTAAIQRIETIVEREQIACDFERVDGYVVLGDADDDQRALLDELTAAHAAGLTDTALAPASPIDGARLGRRYGDALRLPRQAQFHPLKYLAGLARAAERFGAAIYCNTRVIDVDSRDSDETTTITTHHGLRIIARQVIIATNAPVGDRTLLHAKQAPYRSYVLGFRVPAGSVARVLIWDTETPYHYIRVQPAMGSNGDDLLIVGGEDHKTGQAHDIEARFARLDAWSRAHFPMTGQLVYRWSGQVLRSTDGLAYLGRYPGGTPRTYVITGDCCTGITNATIGAMILSDLITGTPNTWAECYDPSRLRLRATPELAKENANVAKQYSKWLTPGDVDTITDIAPGSGAILRQGIHKVAVYKAFDGAITQRSAVCPHLHCIVDWNATEHTWDCPCHGSRFDPYGQVISGPALSDLPRIE